VLDSGKCFAHDEARRAERTAANAKGGKGRARVARVDKLVPASLRAPLALLFQVLDEVHRGELDPRAATAMAAVAGAITRLYSAGVVEDRITELEAQIAALTARRA
jgi:hypothetical protein